MRLLSVSLCLLSLVTALSAQSGTLTHLVNNTVITAGQTPTCNSGATPPQLHAQNSFWRAFNPGAMGITQPIDVTCITYAVEYALASATAVPANAQPIEIRLRLGTNMTAAQFPGTIPAITHTQLISQENVSGTPRIITRGMTNVVTVNPNDLLVVELYLPDGMTPGNVLFPGSNTLGQTAPGYLSSAPCGITVPTPFAGIGFPNTCLLLDVNYVFTGAIAQPLTSVLTLPNATMPGMTDLTIYNNSLMPGHEYWNIYSWQPCAGGVGTGPFLGLCFASISDLMPQLTTPLGVPPFHFLADNCSMTFGPFPVPMGITLDLVTVDYNSLTGVLGSYSPAIQFTL